jgi:DNA-binding NarL/FixJ family response regulator
MPRTKDTSSQANTLEQILAEADRDMRRVVEAVESRIQELRLAAKLPAESHVVVSRVGCDLATYVTVRVPLGAPPRLTPCEQEIAPRVAAGRTNKEIAYELRNSTRTVEGHVRRLHDKYRAQSRVELALRVRLLN